MADYELIEERLISGKGVLKIPEPDQKIRAAILYLDVVRFQKTGYKNLEWNPSKGVYARLAFRYKEYVIEEKLMHFERQAFPMVNDFAGQTLIAVKCAYEGLLQSFANLGVALGVTPVSITDLIKDYENLRQSWDEVLIYCEADAAIQARLYGIKYDTCNPDKDDDQPPPPPPPPLPPVPPGTDIGDISPPYDGDDDDGNTNPYDGDETIPPPPPWGETDSCVRYRVTVSYAYYLGPSNPARFTETRIYWGEIQGTQQIQSGMYVICQGQPGITPACLPSPVPVIYRTYNWSGQNSQGQYHWQVADFRIDAVVPV